MENQIIAILQQINGKLDNLEGILKEHSGILKEHSGILKEHSGILKEHSGILKEHSGILKEHSETLKGQGETLKEHSRILSALRTGQEFNKAELSEMKLQNAKDLGEIKEHLKNQEDSIEILLKETWNNKKDILRVQKTLGLS